MSQCPSCTKTEPCTLKNPCCDCVVRAIREEDKEDEALTAKAARYEAALKMIANFGPAPAITAQYALNPNPS